MYVDLIPIRAAMAVTPEKSKHTSSCDRIETLEGKQIESSAASMQTISQADAETILKTSIPDNAENGRALRRGKSEPLMNTDITP